MPRKHTKERLSQAVVGATSVAGVIRNLGLKWTGGTQALIVRRLKEYQIDISHFTGGQHNKGKAALTRLSPEQLFVCSRLGVREKRAKIYRALLAVGTPELCSGCGVGTEWREQPLVLQIDHINGDPLDNRRENLRILCPNCHSQTATFSGKKRSAA